MMAYDPLRTAEKFQLALEAAQGDNPLGGLCGFELEWNLLDSDFHPLLTVGAGPGQQSFVDYLRENCLPAWAREFSQLEVFHWMIEWATRPYYTPRGAVYEGRLLEGLLLNALARAGRQFGRRLYTWPGNLPHLPEIGPGSIPDSWHLAKRRYLERCVQLYGRGLATAGTHTNLSLPDPLLALDFMHLPPSGRRSTHLDEYKSEFYITATRLMRAFSALFIAASAATPWQEVQRDGRAVLVVSEVDSARNLTFPNPEAVDQPHLYRSYDDYLRISYDLVHSGARFGNNNWTPVRARSFAEPVERMIAITSEQLQKVYARGLYVAGGDRPPGEAPCPEAGTPDPIEAMASEIERQNLLARINLPMARVEVRTDDGGHPLEVEVANLTLKHLLLLRFYADPDFARAFRYDAEDIARARRNELRAASGGLRAEIENPFTGKPVAMRAFLDWTLEELRPLAQALDLWEDLAPLREMAAGGPNTAERLRARLLEEAGEGGEIGLESLRRLAEEREAAVRADVEALLGRLAAGEFSPPGDRAKLSEIWQRARQETWMEPQAPVRFQEPAARAEAPAGEIVIGSGTADKTAEILALAQALIRIPSVTACPEERLDEVRHAAALIYDTLAGHGLQARLFNHGKYPAVLASFPGQSEAAVMLSGHFDVVAPEPDDRQFIPRVEGDYLWGRGAADMKTVVATYLIWMKDRLRQGPPYPPINLLLVGNEENGETEPNGTPHVLRLLAEESAGRGEEAYAPRLLVAGERTGEAGDELWGEICVENRGVMRFEVIGRGSQGHSGVAGAGADLGERLLLARERLSAIFRQSLTLHSPDGWQSQARFPFIQVGSPGVFNVTPALGRLGVEIRPVPADDLAALAAQVEACCRELGLEFELQVMENGVRCDPENPYLQALLRAVGRCSGAGPRLGRKLPGTSARFAPAGQGVVWGQSGLGPHARDERHFIPSIAPYYRALHAFADEVQLLSGSGG